MQKATQAYLQTQVTTTDQGDVLVMLYDGALKFLTRAKELLAANDMAGKGMAISKALDIVNELASTLNMEKGGTLSANLHGLYIFCSKHLVMANLKKDAGMIDDVMRILSGLRSAYVEILHLPEARAAAQELAAKMRADAILAPRAQAGNSPAGGNMPAPGAGGRIRSLFGQQMEQHPMKKEGGSSTAADMPELAAKADPPASLPASDARENAERAKRLEAGAPLPPPASSAEAPDTLQKPTPLSGANTFSPKLPGANVYRKFAAAQR